MYSGNKFCDLEIKWTILKILDKKGFQREPFLYLKYMLPNKFLIAH